MHKDEGSRLFNNEVNHRMNVVTGYLLESMIQPVDTDTHSVIHDMYVCIKYMDYHHA